LFKFCYDTLLFIFFATVPLTNTYVNKHTREMGSVETRIQDSA